jgi:WhiB family redox-sensing transcriptional regulator
MTTPDQDLWLIEIAWRLDRLRWVPRSVLAELVTRSGACMVPPAGGDLPLWDEEYFSDRELAAVLCAGCPVRDECLELELRIAGDQTIGAPCIRTGFSVASGLRTPSGWTGRCGHDCDQHESGRGCGRCGSARHVVVGLAGWCSAGAGGG